MSFDNIRRTLVSLLLVALTILVAAVASAAGLVAASTEVPTAALMVPHFQVETDNPDGLTTLFAVRNETAGTRALRASFYDAAGFLQTTLDFDLVAHAVKTVNVRDVAGLDVDPDDVARGYVIVEPTDGATGAVISGDYFSVTPDEDFATGSNLLDITAATGELCVGWTSRYLNGGAFTGGTLFTIVADEPQGIELTDPPTLFGQVYDEQGAFLGGFEIRTQFQSFQIPANGLVFGQAFGSIEFTFNNTTGIVLADHSASGRFSVGVKGTCTD